MESKQSSRRFSWNLQRLGYPDFTVPNNLWLLRRPALPKFPTPFALTQSAETNAEPKRREGLFTALIGDPAVLYQEYLEEPEKFNPELGDLLQQLIAGQKKLDELRPSEMGQLDAAVLDFAEPRRTPKPQVQSAEEPRAPAALEHVLSLEDALADDSIELEYREGALVPITDGPDESPPTYWWRQ
jgi:hypothetical protein